MAIERGRTAHVSWLRSRPRVDAVFLHGYSGLPDQPFGPTAMADDAAMVLDALDVDREVTVIGGSMGGFTAAVLASRRPDLVAALVLEEPSPGTRAPIPSEPKMSRPDWLTTLKALDTTRRIEWATRRHPTWPADELLPWAEAIGQIDLRIHDLPWEAPLWLPDVMRTVSCQTTFLLGDPAHGSLLDTATESACVCSAGTGATVVRIKRVGHGVHRESRDECLRLITRTIDLHG